MESIQIHAKVQKNGVLILDNLPISEGEDVSVTVNYPTKEKKKKLTGSALRQSGLIGIWKNRDLPDSSEFARQLRNQSQFLINTATKPPHPQPCSTPESVR